MKTFKQHIATAGKAVQNALLLCGLLLTVLINSGCKKYLDEKSNKKLVVPASIKDVQALLDFYALANANFPAIGAQSDDDFFILDSYWANLSLTQQGNYIWDKEVYNDNDWWYMYQVVLQANLALQTLEQIPQTINNTADWQRLKGTALFYRGYAFYTIAQYYAVPYKKSTVMQEPGIPLRLSPDVNITSVRSSLQQTYDQVISDLEEAIPLLPLQSTPLSRPVKAAAWASLARTELTMGEYAAAKQHADSCLFYFNTLLDYKTLNAAATFPVAQFNVEVIFPSVTLTSGMMDPANCKTDTLLYQSYTADDLRKTVFFQSSAGGYVGFKGGYDGSARIFTGIATDEMYLLRAEVNARLGNKDAALADLNTLLVKRWKANTFIAYTAASANEALTKILAERRKELIHRGARWFDLRRLNQEPQFAKTVFRKMNNQLYTLPPEDRRYTHYIPQSVIALSGIQQNTR